VEDTLRTLDHWYHRQTEGKWFTTLLPTVGLFVVLIAGELLLGLASEQRQKSVFRISGIVREVFKLLQQHDFGVAVLRSNITFLVAIGLGLPIIVAFGFITARVLFVRHLLTGILMLWWIAPNTAVQFWLNDLMDPGLYTDMLKMFVAGFCPVWAIVHIASAGIQPTWQMEESRWHRFRFRIYPEARLAVRAACGVAVTICIAVIILLQIATEKNPLPPHMGLGAMFWHLRRIPNYTVDGYWSIVLIAGLHRFAYGIVVNKVWAMVDGWLMKPVNLSK